MVSKERSEKEKVSPQARGLWPLPCVLGGVDLGIRD